MEEANPPILTEDAAAVSFTYSPPVDGETSVEVTFTNGTITHIRDVNATFDEGVYNEAAMNKRVSQISQAVQNKIAVAASITEGAIPEIVPVDLPTADKVTNI